MLTSNGGESTYSCLKNADFWDVTPSGSLRTEILEERSAFFIRAKRIGDLGAMLAVTSNRSRLRISNRVTANVVPSSPVFVTQLMQSLRPSESSVLTRVTRHNNSDDGIIHSHRRGNLNLTYSCLLKKLLVAHHRTIRWSELIGPAMMWKGNDIWAPCCCRPRVCLQGTHRLLRCWTPEVGRIGVAVLEQVTRK
jgi:hypothetical protein